MRECISYNEPEPWQTVQTVVVPYPFGQTRPQVCVDACLVSALQALWAAGIETFNSCCTHTDDGSPEVFIRDNATPDDVARARAIIATVDRREWTILSWTIAWHSPTGVWHGAREVVSQP